MPYTYGDGRIWIQRKKFQPFELLLPYGLTGVTDPVGALAAIREPSPSTRRKSVVVDITRAEPGLPEFAIETRLAKTLNLLFALKDCSFNVQGHMGACDRPDNYYSSEIAMHWQRAHRGDLQVDRLAKIEGDSAPVAVQVPCSAEIGPILVDFQAEFMSARTISESEEVTALFFLNSECLDDCNSQEDAGENGYAATAFKVGSPVNVANVWYTEDKGEAWAETTERPFSAGEDISSIVALGSKANHRVVVARGTADGASPAEIAYADVTSIGTTSWVHVNVGAVNGQYINALLWTDYRYMFAVTNDGYVYRSLDGGATWTAVLTTAVQALNDIAALTSGHNSGVVYTVGASNTIFMSEDTGVTWTAVTGPTGAAGDSLLTACLTPDGTLFIGDDAGEIYGSYDQGVEWTTLSIQGITPTSVVAIRNWGDFNIWVAVNIADGSGRVVRSLDGGATFRLWTLNLPTNSGLSQLAVVDANVVWVTGAPHSGVGFMTKTKSQLLGV